MLETDISLDMSDGGARDAALRPMEWSEIVARLTAARDLRKVLRAGSAGGSFTGSAAEAIGMGNQGKRAVNPDASTDIKARPAETLSHETQDNGGELKQS